jgi:hypothetical protein
MIVERCIGHRLQQKDDRCLGQHQATCQSRCRFAATLAEAGGTTNASLASCASVNRGLRRAVLFVGSKQEDAQGREVTRGGRLLEQLDDGLDPAFSAALLSKERDVRADFLKRVDATVDVA